MKQKEDSSVYSKIDNFSISEKLARKWKCIETFWNNEKVRVGWVDRAQNFGTYDVIESKPQRYDFSIDILCRWW